MATTKKAAAEAADQVPGHEHAEHDVRDADAIEAQYTACATASGWPHRFEIAVDDQPCKRAQIRDGARHVEHGGQPERLARVP